MSFVKSVDRMNNISLVMSPLTVDAAAEYTKRIYFQVQLWLKDNILQRKYVVKIYGILIPVTMNQQ